MDRIDLRSDTVTRPTPAMREAIARAEVGDDVFGDDPTVRELEARIAERTGLEAALFVPSGTMGNQLALRAQSRWGDQLLCHAEAHIHHYEGGAPAALSGLHTTTVATDDGNLPWSEVEPKLHPDDVHCPAPAIVAFENTLNRLGGRVLDPDLTADTARRARRRGLRVHLDGARLWNAEAATGRSVAEWCEPFDSVSLCLSKGLGAPVGSVLASSAEVIRRARRLRKQWGGGMRQVGILAAAGLHALEHHCPALVEDHRRARWLAEAIEHPELASTSPPESNIVLFAVVGERDSAALAREWEAQGLMVSAFGPRTIRLVTHLGVDDDACRRAVEIIARSAREAGSRNPRGGQR